MNRENIQIIESNNTSDSQDYIHILTEYEIFDESDIQDNNAFVNYIDINTFNMNVIPNNVSVSSMSLACNLGILIKIDNIFKYMILEDDNIVAIKSSEGIRCLAEYKSKFKSINKNSKRLFNNQNTMIIRVDTDRFINIKLFNNGSMQMTGCKFLNDANIIINKLIKKFREKLIVKTDNKLMEIDFVNNIEELNITRFKIDLMISNFGVNYLINKENLFKILTDRNVLCRLSAIHACVNIKYKLIDEDKFISIFVFQTGSLIITGAKKPEHIREAFNFIVKFLNENKSRIIKKDINKLLSREEIIEVLNS